jgi:WD40 repeat protein
MLFASFWLDWGLARYIVYDLITYSPLYPFVGVGDLHIDASAFTSDSRVLIMGCDDATIRFSKSDVPEIKRTIKTPSAVRSLTISPNDDLLLATTFDGSIIMYDITSEIILTDIDSYSNDRKSNGITISPNPTSNIIKIQNLDNSLQSLDSDIDISIYNSLGVLMLSLCGQPSVYIGSSGIDVSQFPQGIYNVIISSEYKVWYSKFIKIE